jgi:hypothetical protein
VTAVLLSEVNLSGIRRTGVNKGFLGFFPSERISEAGAVVEATGLSKLFCFAATTMATPFV